ncbi:MAG: hypothetical protein ACM3O8_05370 [Methylococcaceae bacterium]|nr:hypothetical protein [Prolixibacteraceae bacterium]
MSGNTEQKIVVICDFSERMKEVIVHGIRIAQVLNKELCLTACWHRKEQKPVIQDQLIRATESIRKSFPELRISSLLIKNSLNDNIDKLAWEYDAVLVILHKAMLKPALKALRESSIAFLFVQGDSPDFLAYKNVLVPVDYRKATKDTALWSSFLGRFNRSQVQMVYALETDKEQASLIQKNLGFLRKFLSNLKVSHQAVAGKTSSWGICRETVSRAHELKGDVMVMAGSASISLLDLLIGLPEKKIIQKAGDLPVLIINPRKEICMMCD